MTQRTRADLLCRACGQMCPCLIYGKPVDHGHAPGGLLEYVLCGECQKKCLAIHRPIAADGSWKWVDCSDPACGYCLEGKKIGGDRKVPVRIDE